MKLCYLDSRAHSAGIFVRVKHPIKVYKILMWKVVGTKKGYEEKQTLDWFTVIPKQGKNLI